MSARWNSLDLAPKKPAKALSPPATPKEPRAPEAAGRRKETEPAEKHASLPPAPAECGPWQVAHWTIRRTTTYEPTARVVLTGPSSEFEHLLAHLQSFKP